MTSLAGHLASMDQEEKGKRSRNWGVNPSATATKTPYRHMVRRCVPTILAMTLMGGVVLAGEVFFDDFSDGDATNDVPTTRDGIPVQWTPTDQPGIRDASSGDYVVTAVPESEDFMSSDFLDVALQDTSIRGQVRSTSVGGSVVVAVRNQDAVDTQNYHAGIGYHPDHGGTFLWFGRRDSAEAMDYEVFGAVVLPFDIRNSDAMLQLDAVGDELKVWAWQVGDPMPKDPQLITDDNTYPSGFVRISAGSGLNNDNTGTFRFVHVADAHIPEPELADVNLDGEVNGLDVDPFVDVLLNGQYDWTADMNQDGVVNGLDVDPFVTAVVGGGTRQIAEPSTLFLTLVALGVVAGWWKRKRAA